MSAVPKTQTVLDTPEHAEHVALAASKARGFKGDVARAQGIEWLKGEGLASEWPPPAPETPPTPTGPSKLVGADLPRSQGNPRPGSVPLKAAVNHGAEQGVLAAALADPRLIESTFSEVRPDDFADRTRQHVWEAIRDLHGSGHPIDPPILIDALTRGGYLPEAQAAAAVNHLAGIPLSPALAEVHGRIVRESAEVRVGVRAAELFLQDAAAGRIGSGEAVGRVRAIADKLERGGAAGPDADFGFRPWPAPPAEAAWHGAAGDLVREIAPFTEADPVAILFQFLVCFGSVVGRSLYWTVDGCDHHTNLFVVVAGQSSRGRKGTAWKIVQAMTGFMDRDWLLDCVLGGLSSGEGLIDSIRDAVLKGENFTPGVEDKRALFVEEEFSSTISVMGREGNSLSGVLRRAWDGSNLRSSTKNNPIRATDPHVSVIGHTTFNELEKRLGATELFNGFANRFLWVCSRRANQLPEGGDLLSRDFDRHRNRIALAVKWVKKQGRLHVPFDAKAREFWHATYGQLARSRAGRLGPVTDRAEAQTRRLALIYAGLDRSKEVTLPHLQAALECWNYAERSAAYIFGDAETDAFAEKILEALHASKDKGLSKNEINRTLFRGTQAAKVEACLESLITAGLIDVRIEKNGRAKSTIFVLWGGAK
jgi:hypothetical protein